MSDPQIDTVRPHRSRAVQGTSRLPLPSPHRAEVEADDLQHDCDLLVAYAWVVAL